MTMQPMFSDTLARHHRSDLMRDADQARLVRAARSGRRATRRSFASTVRAAVGHAVRSRPTSSPVLTPSPATGGRLGR